MKKYIIIGFFIFFVLIILFSKNTNEYEDYDKGYDAGWDEEEPSAWASKAEKQGYEDGAEDSETYDLGYDDGYNKRKPLFKDDELYMDAYKEGKKDNK